MTCRIGNVSRGAVVAAGLFLLTASSARADIVLDWNATMRAVINQPPFPGARSAAITQLAVFEAVNAIVGDYESYLGQSIPAPAGASAEAAVAAAAHKALITLFPAQSSTLNAALAASLATIEDGPAESDGVAVGVAAAVAVLALRTNDGAAVPESYLPPASAGPGDWLLTGNCPASGGSFAHWARVTPFVLDSADRFRPGPPPHLNGGKYRKDFNEVKAVGEINSVLRTQDRTDVAHFYARYSPVTWANVAAAQVATIEGDSLSENARAFALLNMALSDAAVATFEAKYYYKTWRPETAIHLADTDGNAKTEPDPAYKPLVNAPCFPGYPSNHATLSYAAREVLERLYGPQGHDITLATALLPGVVLNYTAFKQITEDVDDARVYGGIHFRFDQDAGAKLGTKIGAYVVKNSLRVVHP
ncbi:MAG: vanadium-dependent haloperoxidase [Acidobacteria bacterium]|nr:vanadium-dependent haloperoxidase [Acidobacteriota bacterium]